LEWIQTYKASHVIVTSYIFTKDNESSKTTLDWEKLKKLVDVLGGPQHLVLDLSCRKKPEAAGDDGLYYVVANKWQTYTDFAVTPETLKQLSEYCDEFLIHGVENEGKQCGVLEDLIVLLTEHSPIPTTYAGGVRNMDDVYLVQKIGKGKIDLTIGSALDCFGGKMSYKEVVQWHHEAQQG